MVFTLIRIHFIVLYLFITFEFKREEKGEHEIKMEAETRRKKLLVVLFMLLKRRCSRKDEENLVE